MICFRTISLHNLCKLIVLLLFLLFGHCRQSQKDFPKNISIIWNGNRAIAISIPLDLVDEIPRDSIRRKLVVQKIPGANKVGILGEYEIKQENLVFTPLIPFTRGLQYGILQNNKSLFEFAVPPARKA